MTHFEDWKITRTEFNLKTQNHDETIFMVGNGYLSTRGSFEEGLPGENAATFVHGVFDDIPIVFTELVNLPNWMSINLTLDGHPFRMDQGEILSYRRTLNLKTALVTREVKWRSPGGKTYRLIFERYASLANQHLLLVRVGIEPLGFDSTVHLQAGLNGYASNLGFQHWNLISQEQQGPACKLELETNKTKIRVGMAFCFTDDRLSTVTELWDVPQLPTISLPDVQINDSEMRWFEKRVVLFTSRDVFNPSEKALETLLAQQKNSWDFLFLNHVEAWEKVWETSDIQIESEDNIQEIIRFNLYQLLIAAPWEDEQVNIGAKSLSGYGYRGHSFWDTEIFMLPFFTHTQPAVARNLLSYRYHRLSAARTKAAQNRYAGAQFPWESADTGEEVTPTWVPNEKDRMNLIRIWTGDIQIHVSADIAFAIYNYWKLTGDLNFMLERGLPIIMETALFWQSRAEWCEEEQNYQFRDVIGPDEYHEHVNNNAYTNFIARWHLNTAASLYEWCLEHNSQNTLRILHRDLNINASLIKDWRRIASAIQFNLDSKTGLIEQFDGFYNLEEVDWNGLEPRKESIQALYGIERTNQLQALKQADVLMILYLFPEYFDQTIVQKNYDFYSARTDHSYGSSLGPSIHALIACQLGKINEAYRHFLNTAYTDMYDVRDNAGDGIHAASAGGLWQTVVFGFAGLRIKNDRFTIHPQLPKPWKTLRFKFYLHGEVQEVNIQAKEQDD